MAFPKRGVAIDARMHSSTPKGSPGKRERIAPVPQSRRSRFHFTASARLAVSDHCHRLPGSIPMRQMPAAQT